MIIQLQCTVNIVLLIEDSIRILLSITVINHSAQSWQCKRVDDMLIKSALKTLNGLENDSKQ